MLSVGLTVATLTDHIKYNCIQYFEKEHFQLRALFLQLQNGFTLSKKQTKENPKLLFCQVTVRGCPLTT